MTLTTIPDTHTTHAVDDPAIAADIEKFRTMLAGYQAGEIDEDVFRVYRLTNGIYGQRQGGTNQMLRVRIPYGSLGADQLRVLAEIAETRSRGWGHITTRQNIQFHYVQLDEIAAVLEQLGSVGMTTREACGDTVRNVQGCHLAGACPFEALDITPWAEAVNNHLLRNPLGQRLPRKFKINFSGCSTDCGQAMFNDVGVVAVSRTGDDGRPEAGFRVYVAGGLGANPHPALAVEDFTPREQLLPTVEAVLRVFEQTGDRDNKRRARMKWVVDRLGWDETRRRILASRRLLPASATWPGGLPMEVLAAGDGPAGQRDAVDGIGAAAVGVSAVGHGVPVAVFGSSPFDRWQSANVIRGAANLSVSAYAHCRLGDITAAQFRGLAALVDDLDVELRLTNRQNIAIRGLGEDQLPELYTRLVELDMASPGAELSRDVVACPGADTCNLAVTQSRGLADAITDRLELDGLAEIGGVRINISGCPNSCGQHHVADLGFFGVERRAGGHALPGYQLLLGGHLGDEAVVFGAKALRLPAKAVPEAASRVLRRFVDEREAGEPFRRWLDRVGGAGVLAADLADLDDIPSLDDRPDYYVDYGETSPFAVELGESECAT